MVKNSGHPSPETIAGKYDTDEAVRSAVDAAHESRQEYMHNVAKLAPHLPQLTDAYAKEIYDQIEEHEHRIVPSLGLNEYGEGMARHDDEIWSGNTNSDLLLSAEHATDPVRKSTGVREGADHGTGGLAMALSDNKDLAFVLPAGRQTGNANVDSTHIMKDRISDLLPNKKAFISVHGMIPGKFSHQYDDREIHAVIGLGKNPEEANRELANRLIQQALDELGLRVVIGNDTLFFGENEGTPRLQYDSDGKVKHAARLAALGEGSTTNYVRREVGDPLFPAMQIEISRTLRLLPKELEYRDARRKVMSVYMGYLLSEQLIEIVANSTKEENKTQ